MRSITSWGDVDAAIVATLFYAALASAFTLGALRDGAASKARVVLLTSSTVIYVSALELLFDGKQTTLGLLLVALAAALFIATRIRALPPALRQTYAFLGTASATLAIPALFHATSRIDVFAVEAALLVANGARTADRRALVAGAALFALTGIAILSQTTGDAPHRSLFNELSLGYAVYLAALGFALWRYAPSEHMTRAQRGWRNVAIIAWNLVALAALSRECVDLLGGPKGFEDLANEAQFGLSAIWTIYATALFSIGLARRHALLRWLGFVLFGCTVFKVLVVDLAALNVMYRILSFFVVGAVLVAVSLWYQRAMVRQNAGAEE